MLNTIIIVLCTVTTVSCQGNTLETDVGPACTEIGQTWTSPMDGAVLVCVPAGEFLMGAAESDAQATDDEKPPHPVYLDAFWLDRTEVTNANFAKCMEAGACRPEIYEVSALTYTPYGVHPDYQDFPALLYEADVAARRIVSGRVDVCRLRPNGRKLLAGRMAEPIPGATKNWIAPKPVTWAVTIC